MLEDILQITAKLHIDPVVTLFDIYPTKLSTYVHTNICAKVFTGAETTIPGYWKQLKCPSVEHQRQWSII
jgi:hypothetical protein